MRHHQIDGKPLIASTTTCISKDIQGTRLIAGSNGKKVEDWEIRIQASKFDLKNFESNMGKVQRLEGDGRNILRLRYSLFPIFNDENL